VGLIADRVLRLDRVGDRVRKRAVVADRARKHGVDIVLHALVHHALADDPVLDGGFDPARADDLRDGPDVVFVALPRVFERLHVHPERGAVQRALEVVGGEAVARRERVDVACLDQLGERVARSRVDHRGAGDDHHVPAGLGHLAELLGDLSDRRLRGALRGDAALHEAERAAPLRGRSGGFTRIPDWSVATRSSSSTALSTFVYARGSPSGPPSGSTISAQSISIRSTSIHSPSYSTSVGWFVVE